MMPSRAIRIVTDPLLDHVLNAAADRLARQGHRVERVGNDQPAAGQGNWAGTDLLVATGRTRLDAATLQGAHRLRGIAYPTIGTDRLDLEAARRLGIAAAIGAVPENVSGMAEATIALMLSALLQLPQKRHLLEAGAPRPSLGMGTGLAGKVVGLIGFGRIASAVANRLAGWDVTLLACAGGSQAARGTADGARSVSFVPLTELLSRSDVVSLHASASPGTPPLLGRDELSVMKPGAVLINTARGSLVDEEALAEALAGDRLAGAALDTFAVEPLPVESPLRRLPNVMLTPHNAGHTREAIAAILPALIENGTALLEGRRPLWLRDETVVPAWMERLRRLDDDIRGAAA